MSGNTKAIQAKLGRHCVICGRMGGAGMAYAIRLLYKEAQRVGAPLNWHSTDIFDAKAHGDCVIREKGRINAFAETMSHD
jgi:hypothetical protein